MCRLNTTVLLSSSLCNVYLYLIDSDDQNIYDNRRQKIKSIVVNMLHNYNHMYYSYNNNIICVDSTIKYIDFESFYYVINLDVISSYIVFSDIDSVFLSMYC